MNVEQRIEVGEIEVSCWQIQRQRRKMMFVVKESQVSGEQIPIRERSRRGSISYQQKRERDE